MSQAGSAKPPAREPEKKPPERAPEDPQSPFREDPKGPTPGQGGSKPGASSGDEAPTPEQIEADVETAVAAIAGDVSPRNPPAQPMSAEDYLKLLDTKRTAPDTSAMSPSQAAQATGVYAACEAMRTSAQTLRDLAKKPLTQDPNAKGPGVAKANEARATTIATTRMLKGSMGDALDALSQRALLGARAEGDSKYWGKNTKDLAPRISKLSDALRNWEEVRSGADSTDLVKVSAAAKDVIDKLTIVLSSNTDLTNARASDIYRRVAAMGLEVSRQVGEHLSGGSYVVPSKSDALIYAISSSTDRYAGAFSAQQNLADAAKQLAQVYPKESFGTALAATAKPYDDALAAYKTAMLPNPPANALDPATALNNLVSAASSFADALGQARQFVDGELSKGVPTQEAALADTMAASLYLNLHVGVERVASAGDVLVTAKLDAIRQKITGKAIGTPIQIVDEKTLPSFFDKQMDSLKSLVKGTADEKTFLKAIKGASLSQELTKWGTACKGMPKSADDVVARTWRVFSALGEARAILNTSVGDRERRQVGSSALDRIAQTVAYTMFNYHQTLPDYI